MKLNQVILCLLVCDISWLQASCCKWVSCRTANFSEDETDQNNKNIRCWLSYKQDVVFPATGFVLRPLLGLKRNLHIDDEDGPSGVIEVPYVSGLKPTVLVLILQNSLLKRQLFVNVADCNFDASLDVQVNALSDVLPKLNDGNLIQQHLMVFLPSQVNKEPALIEDGVKFKTTSTDQKIIQWFNALQAKISPYKKLLHSYFDITSIVNSNDVHMPYFFMTWDSSSIRYKIFEGGIKECILSFQSNLQDENDPAVQAAFLKLTKEITDGIEFKRSR